MRYAVALRGTLRLRIGNELFSRRPGPPPPRRGGGQRERASARVSPPNFSLKGEADVAGEKQLHVAVSWTRGSKVHASKLGPGPLAQVSRINSFGNLTPRKKTRFRKFPGKSDLRRRRRRPPRGETCCVLAPEAHVIGEQQISTLADAIRAALMLRYNDRPFDDRMVG